MKLNKLTGPWRITFDTNPDECNISCIMCERQFLERLEKRKKPRRMSTSLIEKIVLEGLEMGELCEIIPSTMGEPLLFDNFDIFIDLCNEKNLKLNLTTNGTFPRRDIEEWGDFLLPICSDIKISWNGLTKETDEAIMQGRSHSKAQTRLIDFIKIRDKLRHENNEASTITLQLTFLEQNYKEIPDLIKWAIDLGIDRVKGHHLWVHDKRAEKWSMRRSDDSIKRWDEMIASLNPSYRRKIRLENLYPISSKEEVILQNSVCPFLGREAWISAAGDFSPCCAPDDLRKQLGDFGNVKEKSLREIWYSEEYSNLCLNYDHFYLCKTCNMRKKQQDVYKYES